MLVDGANQYCAIPTLFQQADYVLVESTYGDRDFDIKEGGPSQLAAEINRTAKAGGNIVVPAFAFERSQEILYYLNELIGADRIPHLMTFVDSPMAVNLIDVFENHPEFAIRTWPNSCNRRSHRFASAD